MSTRITVEATDDIIEKARLNCIREGSNLQEFLTEIVTKKAKAEVPDARAVLHESSVEKEIWAPSRATLFAMRQNGELVEGVEGDPESGDYYKKSDTVYYFLSKLRKFFKKSYPHIEEANIKRRDKKQTQSA